MDGSPAHIEAEKAKLIAAKELAAKKPEPAKVEAKKPAAPVKKK